MYDERFESFAQTCSRIKSDYTTRNKIIATAVAAAVAYSVALPTSAPDDALNDFHVKHSDICEVILKFNEAVVFEKGLAFAMLDKFYNLRVQAAFACDALIPCGCFITSLVGANRYFSEEETCLMADKAEDIACVFACVSQCIKTMQ